MFFPSTPPCYISIRQHFTSPSTPFHVISPSARMLFSSPPLNVISPSANILLPPPHPSIWYLYPPRCYFSLLQPILSFFRHPPSPCYFSLRFHDISLSVTPPPYGFSPSALHVISPSVIFMLFIPPRPSRYFSLCPSYYLFQTSSPPVTPYVIFPSALLPHIYSTPRALISPSATPLSNSPSS